MKKVANAVPAPGKIVRTPIPDSLDGIRFELGRLVKYVQDGHKDPRIITLAQKIAELSSGTARQLGRAVNGKTQKLIWLRGIHAWCHGHFEHLPNPANVEVLKSPARMLRELDIPEAFAQAVWEPIRDKMARDAKKDPSKLSLPKPKITGSSAVAVCLVLTLAAAVGIVPVRIRLGGHDGTLHYAWGQVEVGGKWYDVDITLPTFGKHEQFDTYEFLEIPL